MRKAYSDTDSDWTGDSAYKMFRTRWVKCLKLESRDWDGKKAMRELKSTGAFTFLNDTTKWQQSELLGRIFAETQSYNREVKKLNSAELFQQEMKVVKNFLRQLQQHADKKRLKMHYPELARYLANVSQELEQAIERLPKTVTFWKRRNARSPLTVYEQFFPQRRRMWLIKQKLKLDLQFQIQTAKMFAFYLDEYHCSRQTYARLIVLTYIVAGFAGVDPKTKFLRVHNTDRKLTFRSVCDNIDRLQKPINPNG